MLDHVKWTTWMSLRYVSTYTTRHVSSKLLSNRCKSLSTVHVDQLPIEDYRYVDECRYKLQLTARLHECYLAVQRTRDAQTDAQRIYQVSSHTYKEAEEM